MTSPARTSPSIRRLALAFAVIPFLPGFYGALIFGQPWAFPIGLCVAYPSALVIGVPTVVIMVRGGWLQWWSFTLAGMLCALPALGIYAWMGDVPHLAPFDFIGALLVVGWGAFSGACFWLLGVFGEKPLTLRDLFDAGPPSK